MGDLIPPFPLLFGCRQPGAELVYLDAQAGKFPGDVARRSRRILAFGVTDRRDCARHLCHP